MLSSMDTASTGIPALDGVLGGVFWGDNVVYEGGGHGTTTPFAAAAWAVAGTYDAATWVALGDLDASPPGATVLDATADGSLAKPGALLEALRAACSRTRRDLVVLDSLDHAVQRWGAAETARFFVQACPMMLGLGAVAIWQLSSGRPSALLRRRIAEVTQIILAVGDGVVRVEKAEGRPPGVQGTVFRYELDDGSPVLTQAHAAARLGAGLRRLRRERLLSQAEVARLAGVSPSAISQAERSERGLSLETLLTLTGKLGISLDELLHGGDVGPGYRLARRTDPHRDVPDEPVTLLGDPKLGLRAYAVRLAPGGSTVPGFAHKGVEIVAVAQGLVQVVLPTGRPVLRKGEALVAEASGVEGWRNLSDEEALAFWVVRD